MIIGWALVVAASAASAEPAKQEPKAQAQAKSSCKRVDHKTVCTVEAPVVVSAPKPNVVIVPEGGRKTVGRPKHGDRLTGLSHQLR